MDRCMRVAIVVSGILVSGAVVTAQDGPASSPRPFSRLFATPAPELPPALKLRLIDNARQRLLKARPPGTRCDMIVVPVDPRLDPRMSIAPPAATRFFLREVRPDCR